MFRGIPAPAMSARCRFFRTRSGRLGSALLARKLQYLKRAEEDMSMCATDQAAVEPEPELGRMDAVLATVTGQLGLLRCLGKSDDLAT
jgi:hypothetical protein